MHVRLFQALFLILPLSLFLSAARTTAGAPTGWDKEQAGKYLDAREKVWFEEFPGAERGEGAGKTCCVSCHSVAPYAMARPILRRLTGEKEPTRYERQIVERTRKRVAHWKELDQPQFQLFYDFNDAKKKESWGTEAVLNSFVLAFDDAYAGRQEPSEATKLAFGHLWKMQATEGALAGSWDWLDFSLQPWESKDGRYYGALLAALAVATAPGYFARGADAEHDRRVELLRGYLRKQSAQQNLFNRAWLLWAATKMEGLLSAEERQQILTELRGQQQPDGGWRLASLGKFVRNDGTPQDTGSDGYATGLIVHVLQVAGLPKDEPGVARGLAWLRSNQKPSGAWFGSSVNKKRDPDSSQPAKAHVGKFMGDAATAYAVLALSHGE